MYSGQLKLGLVLLLLKIVVKLNTFRTNDKYFHFTTSCFCVANSQSFQCAWKAEPGILGMQSLSVMDVFVFSLLLRQQHLKT